MHRNQLPPKILPANWTPIGEFGPGGWTYVDRRRRLSVIQTLSDKNDFGDGRTWLHVSIASPDRMPTYDELIELKATFVGEDRKAIMVLPPRSEHVNIHPNCLHLYCCLDGDPLPDFTTGKEMI